MLIISSCYNVRLLTYDVKLYLGIMSEYTGSLIYSKFCVVASLKLSTNTIIVATTGSSIPGVWHIINPLQDNIVHVTIVTQSLSKYDGITHDVIVDITHCSSPTRTVWVFPMLRFSPVMLSTVPPETGPLDGNTRSNFII